LLIIIIKALESIRRMATFPHNYKVNKETPCVISVDGESYDVSSWRLSHPGGAESLDNFNDRDATEAFYALHSQEAIAKLKRMGKKPTDMNKLKEKPPAAALAFRDFRKKLEREGWFQRKWYIDFAYIFAVFMYCVVGTWISRSHPVLASIILGLAIEQAGWLGHDYGHGRG